MASQLVLNLSFAELSYSIEGLTLISYGNLRNQLLIEVVLLELATLYDERKTLDRHHILHVQYETLSIILASHQ